jgi:hypothetical protein
MYPNPLSFVHSLSHLYSTFFSFLSLFSFSFSFLALIAILGCGLYNDVHDGCIKLEMGFFPPLIMSISTVARFFSYTCFIIYHLCLLVWGDRSF